MKNANRTPAFLFLSFLLLLIPVAASSDTTDTTDIVVKGKRLDEAMSSGDYYNIGRYYADRQKAKWERQQRRNQSGGGRGEKSDISEQQEKCKLKAALKRNECERDAQETYSNNIRSCPSGFSFSIPYIGSLQYQTGAFARCEVNMRSTRNKHIIICKEVGLRYQKSECL